MTVLGLKLGLLSGVGQQVHFQVDDLILIVHNGLASDRQRLSGQGLQVTTMDLTLAAARLTVHGAGEFAYQCAACKHNGSAFTP